MAHSKIAARPSPSTVLAAVLVLGAAAFAIYGLWPSAQPSPATGETSVTLPPLSSPPGQVRRIPGSGLPTRVVVERLAIDAAVSEVGVIRAGDGASWETAWRSAGHHMDSALPGQPGNLVLSGHVSVADPRNLAVFSTLEEAAQGDVVQVFSGRDVHTYVVANVAVVSPDAVWFLRSDHTATVTLITCTRDLKNRVVVVGKLV